MNKIQVLIDNGFITDNDIQEYIVSNQLDDCISPKDIDYPWDSDYDDMMNQMINEECDEQVYDEPEINTDYVIASTNEMLQETMVFPANEHGQITQYTDLTSIALRNGHEYWEDAFAAVILLNTDEYKYIHVRTLESDKNIHNLFKKINTSDIIVI